MVSLDRYYQILELFFSRSINKLVLLFIAKSTAYIGGRSFELAQIHSLSYINIYMFIYINRKNREV